MKHKVLIVDDDTDDQILFVEAILNIDPFCECDAVENGVEALNFLRNTNTLPSVILLDLNMPLMNGHLFLQKVKKIADFKHIPIAVFSTSTNIDDDQTSKKLGANFFFTKPNNIKDLEKAITKIMFPATGVY